MVTSQKKSRTIKVNSKFKNVIEFRRTLAHYAIMNEFAYYIEKSEPSRVTARCLDLECKWRIHASVMEDGISFEFNGVLVAATGVDGNSSIFPVAYGVLESENKNSWIWFLELLKKAIGTPNGLVLSSDMQKGLDISITQVYPTVEHRECVRHLYSNFKRHCRGEFFTKSLWHAARTYRLTEHERLLKEIGGANKDALKYLNDNHNRIWCRGKFGTTLKCDYITNNISETFNSWIGEVRYKPILDLLDSVREKIMIRLDNKRRLLKKWKGTLVPNTNSYLNKISKNLGEYEVSRSGENRAEVRNMDNRWDVSLDERKCSCRRWQVNGIPCVHAAAFIIFSRDANWDKYVDFYFSVEKYKLAYALEVAPMPTKDQWVHIDNEEKIYPPTIKRPPGRPRKNRIKPNDETKKRQKCKRCGEYGHRQKTCKNAAPQDEASTSERKRGKNA